MTEDAVAWKLMRGQEQKKTQRYAHFISMYMPNQIMVGYTPELIYDTCFQWLALLYKFPFPFLTTIWWQ